VTTLIAGGFVLPMAPGARRVLLDPGAVLVDDGLIVAVGLEDEVRAHPLAANAEVVDATGCAVIPGLHNTHLHSGLLRGTAEDLGLLEWLATYVDPMHRAVTAPIAEAASRLCYAEALLGGTTSVMDMWRHLEGAAGAADTLGLRATLVPYVCDGPALDYFETLATNRELLEHVGTTGRVRAWVGLEHLLYCTEPAYTAAVKLADEFGAGIHTHSSEQVAEVETVERLFGRRPIHEIAARGLLDGGRCVMAHCVQLDDAELDVLAETGTRVAHCPCSNLKLASGVARVRAMWERAIPVGLGSDGEKENNNLDLFEEMKFASLLMKGLPAAAGEPADPAAGNAYDVLAMATIEGARTLGLDGITGSLEPGKAADIVAVELRKPHTTPIIRPGRHGVDANIAQHLVFSSSAADVRSVWVQGRLVVDGHRLLTGDTDAIVDAAQSAAEELFARRRAQMSQI
jgi:5-methylthioadenosine/S-adenosylhomocysteine deaminase